MPVTATKKHPILNAIIRRRVIVEIHKTHGYSMSEARDMAADLTDDLIHNGIMQTEGAVGAIGDGTLIQKLIDFLNSDTGKALIALLIKLLGL